MYLSQSQQAELIHSRSLTLLKKVDSLFLSGDLIQHVFSKTRMLTERGISDGIKCGRSLHNEHSQAYLAN